MLRQNECDTFIITKLSGEKWNGSSSMLSIKGLGLCLLNLCFGFEGYFAHKHSVVYTFFFTGALSSIFVALKEILLYFPFAGVLETFRRAKNRCRIPCYSCRLEFAWKTMEQF